MLQHNLFATVYFELQRLGSLEGGLALCRFGNHFAGFLHYGPTSVAEHRVVVGNDGAIPPGKICRIHVMVFSRTPV